MIVAFRAAGGGAHPNSTEGADVFSFEGVERFFFNDARFAVGVDEAIVGGGSECAVVSVGEEITSELFAGELIEGHVVAEGFDDVLAIRCGGDGFVGNHAVGIGVSDEVEPEKSLVLGVLKRGEPFLGEFFVVLWRGIFFESCDFLDSGWETAEVEGKTAEESAGIGFLDWLDFVFIPSAFEECVDGVIRSGWDFRPGEFLVGPVFFVFRAFLDPLLERFLLFLGKTISRIERGHVVVFVVGEDAVDQFAVIGFTRDDGGGLAVGGALEGVEAKVGFPLFLVEAVAEEAILREDGTNIAVVADLS